MKRPIRQAAWGAAAIAGVAMVVWTLAWLPDLSGVPGAAPWELFASPAAAPTVRSFGNVSVGILGMAITVVAIIVELAANRYTARITELFVRDPVNQIALSFFAVVALLAVWSDLSLAAKVHPTTLVATATVGLSAAIILILPYFVYVFDFLGPSQVIARIRSTAESAMAEAAAGLDPIASRDNARNAVEQLGDIVLNAVDQKDKAIAVACLTALGDVAVAEIRQKASLPEAWFAADAMVAADPDLAALDPEVVRALVNRRTWVEMKVFRQYQAAFGDALNRMRDVNHLVGRHTRRIALAAIEADDPAAAALSMRFLNTYVRAALNARDVRSAFHLLQEVGHLAADTLDRGREDLTLELAQRIKFYGQLGFSMQIPFLLETAAYDLEALLEVAAARDAQCHGALLELFVDVDREPEGGRTQEASLRGVRKAQLKLATWYLVRGRETEARRIATDLRHETAERLASIRNEMLAVTEPEYWEVSDRATNFEYLPPEQRAQLDVLFGWLRA